VDRWCSYALRVLAIGCGCAAVLLALGGFVEYLQFGRWPTRSLLDAAYELRVVRARWFLANEWSWPLHNALRSTPVTLVVLALSPICWWLGNRLSRR
jgi:hypothetical protein